MLPDASTLATSIPDLISLTFHEDLLVEEFDGSACLLFPTNELWYKFNKEIVEMLPEDGRTCPKSMKQTQ